MSPRRKPGLNANACCATTKHGGRLRPSDVSGSRRLLAGKSAPKGALRYILTELARGDYRLCDGLEKQHRFACELLGIDDANALIATISNAGDARAQMIATNLVLGAYEADLAVHTWRNPNARAARYFS